MATSLPPAAAVGNRIRKLRAVWCETGTLNCDGGTELSTDNHGNIALNDTWPARQLLNGSFDCSSSANACQLVILTDDITDPALVRMPVSFAPTTAVASSYSTAELNVVAATGNELEFTPDQYQRISTAAVSFIFGLLPNATSSPFDNTGTHTITTYYPAAEYAVTVSTATRLGLTVGEYQKLSAIVVAYLLGLN